MRAPDFLLSAFFSIHGAAGSPAHTPGLRWKCPPRSLRITSSSRLIMSRGIYSTSFREKYKNDADMYENEFTPKPYVRISSHRSVKRPQRELRQWMPSASKLQRVKNRLSTCGLYAKTRKMHPGISSTSMSAIFSETASHFLYIQMFNAANKAYINAIPTKT